MRRWMAVPVLALLLLFCCAAASAERPAGGVRRQPLLRTRTQFLTEETGAVLSGPAQVTAGEPGVWTVNLPSGCVSYDFYVCVDDDIAQVVDGVRYLDTLYCLEGASGATVTYDLLYTPGDYWIFLYCNTAGGGVARMEQSQFTVTASAGGNAFDNRLNQIARSCRGADDFETVVNVHDWILANNEYDDSYSYYSAEAVIFRGTGVCNSYARLFRLLMERLGIPVRYVGGYAMGEPDSGHAWNTVQIDGQWYGMDLTWDDGFSGLFCTYQYCGLPDELMNLSHTPTQYAPGGPVSCTSLDSHYLVRSGR